VIDLNLCLRLAFHAENEPMGGNGPVTPPISPHRKIGVTRNHMELSTHEHWRISRVHKHPVVASHRQPYRPQNIVRPTRSPVAFAQMATASDSAIAQVGEFHNLRPSTVTPTEQIPMLPTARPLLNSDKLSKSLTYAYDTLFPRH
jgi:hypothetical protein